MYDIIYMQASSKKRSGGSKKTPQRKKSKPIDDDDGGFDEAAIPRAIGEGGYMHLHHAEVYICTYICGGALLIFR